MPRKYGIFAQPAQGKAIKNKIAERDCRAEADAYVQQLALNSTSTAFSVKPISE